MTVFSHTFIKYWLCAFLCIGFYLQAEENEDFEDFDIETILNKAANEDDRLYYPKLNIEPNSVVNTFFTTLNFYITFPEIRDRFENKVFRAANSLPLKEIKAAATNLAQSVIDHLKTNGARPNAKRLREEFATFGTFYVTKFNPVIVEPQGRNFLQASRLYLRTLDHYAQAVIEITQQGRITLKTYRQISELATGIPISIGGIVAVGIYTYEHSNNTQADLNALIDWTLPNNTEALCPHVTLPCQPRIPKRFNKFKGSLYDFILVNSNVVNFLHQSFLFTLRPNLNKLNKYLNSAAADLPTSIRRFGQELVPVLENYAVDQSNQNRNILEESFKKFFVRLAHGFPQHFQAKIIQEGAVFTQLVVNLPFQTTQTKAVGEGRKFYEFIYEGLRSANRQFKFLNLFLAVELDELINLSTTHRRPDPIPPIYTPG